MGFYTFQQMDEYNTIINELYILKNHHEKNLTFEILLNLFIMPNTIFYIRNPNQNMIKVLLKNDLAIRIEKNLIYIYSIHNFQ